VIPTSCVFERAIGLASLCGLLLACEPSRPGDTDGEGGAGAQDSGWGADQGSGSGHELVVLPSMYTPIDLPARLLTDGDEMELWDATQGGHVILAGARIRGLDREFIELRARLRDLDTGFMITEAVRTVVVAAVEGEPEWLETDRRSRSQVAHLALCPNYEAKPIADTPYQLELVVTELYDDFETGFASVTIVPTCMQTNSASLERCHCECEADYVLGKCSG
jgi:hypothetical protein